MKLYSETKEYKLYNDNMLNMLENIPENSVDSIVTDPPYEINFMNKKWDNSGIAFKKNTWEKCLKVLKPGGYLLSFGGSRTFHRIACAIEDAGFEIRDTIMWIYGNGMAKSLNIEKQLDKTDISQEIKNKWKGWGTSLKPSYEPIIVARKPINKTVAENILEYGVGGINIDECRISLETGYKFKTTKRQPRTKGNVFDENSCGFKSENNTTASANPKGRFPANIILSYGENSFEWVCGDFPITKGGGEIKEKGKFGYCFSDGKRDSKPMADGYNDSGSAARYFKNCEWSNEDLELPTYIYEAKANTKDRNEGLNSKNIHPTVKNVNLMRYLVILVTPLNGTVLDPFNGSGSTGKAIMYENKERKANYKYIGIELNKQYLDISKKRIDYIINTTTTKETKEQLAIKNTEYIQSNLFDEEINHT